MNVTPYYSEDNTKVALLLTTKFGSGWSTYNQLEFAYDKRIVEWWINHHDACYYSKIKDFNSSEYKEFLILLKQWGYNKDYINTYGYSNIQLQWVECGRKWQIEEYDGREYLVFADEQHWNSF